jgi:Spy/CpxP family protein refolding chaperone
MRRGLPWMLLGFSLLFNVFFAAGALRARGLAGGAPDPAAAGVANELELDEVQRAIFRELRDGMREDSAFLNEAIALAERDLVQVLGRERPDLEQARAIVARVSDFHRQRRIAASHRFGEFMEMLRPEQCRRLAGHLPGKRPGGPPGHGGERPPGGRDMLERFDADRDGTMSDDEWASLRQFLEGRWEERRNRRAELLKRFDRDGDGTLSDEEEAERREWMRQNRAPRQPGGERDGGGPGSA